MKYNHYRIEYKTESTTIFELKPYIATEGVFCNSKLELVEEYIKYLKTNNIWELKAFKNNKDITAKINEFLNK